MNRRLQIILLLCLAAVTLKAEQFSLDALRSMVKPGESKLLDGDYTVQLRVLTEAGHPNIANGYQSSYRSSTSRDNNRTAYAQSEDGTCGVRLYFQHYEPEAIKLKRYSLITLNLDGATLAMTAKGAFSIEDLPNGSILYMQPGLPGDVPVKVKKLSELTPMDYHTWVTVKDCEFVFKDGAYMNVLEQYSRGIPQNKQYNPNSMMDTWQTLMSDADMTPLYLVINAKTPWRRSGNGVPQGRGLVSGVLVDSENPRYGHVDGWQIRPMEESDIVLEWKGDSSFKTLCEWNWNDNVNTFNTNEGPVERFRYEKMLPDIGKGELTLDFLSSTYRGFDVNNPVLEPKGNAVKGDRGRVMKGAMEIRSLIPNWWNWGDDCGSAVVLKFSTKDVDAERLFLAFSFSCGSNSATGSRFNPAFWGVEISTDNIHFARMDHPDIEIKALPWWESVLDGTRYVTSAVAGAGMTEHMMELPKSLLGQENVYVRICPVSKALTTLAMEGNTNAALRQNMKTWSYVSFGAITIRYR